MTSVQKIAKRRLLALNDQGRRIGETHWRAKLTDHEVGLVLELLDGGMSERLVAEKMEISRRTVRDYKGAKTRAQTATAYVRASDVVTVHLSPAGEQVVSELWAKALKGG